MNGNKREVISDLVIRVTCGEIDSFSQATVGIDYEKGIPKLKIGLDLKDQSISDYRQYDIYTDGTEYALITNDEKHETTGILSESDFVNFVITIRYLIENYVTENVFKKINSEHVEYNNMIGVLYKTYCKFWHNFINEKTIDQLANNDKSLLKYRNFDNLDVPSIFNNENRIYQAGSIYLIFCDVTCEYYSEIINDNIYITLMITRDSVTLHEIIKVNPEPDGVNGEYNVIKNIHEQLCKFVSPMVDSTEEQNVVVDKFNQTIERMIDIGNDCPDMIELHSKTTNLRIARDEDCLYFKAIGDFYYKIEIPQSYIHKTNYTEAIKEIISEFPLVAKLELHRVAEAITRGREILYTYLGKDDECKIAI